MSDTADLEAAEADRAPWTIKGMRRDDRRIATECANKADETMAEWLGAAIREKADRAAGTTILPPDARADRKDDPANGASGLAVYTPRAPVDMTGLAGMLSAAVEAAKAAGVPLSKTMARQAMALTSAQLRQARGLPEKPSRQPSGQTKHENGQTIEAEAGDAAA